MNTPRPKKSTGINPNVPSTKSCTFFKIEPAIGNIEKVGAGEAMLALLSISLHKSYDKSISLFIGSLAAAQSVESIGNSKAVNKNQMLKTIQHLLK